MGAYSRVYSQHRLVYVWVEGAFDPLDVIAVEKETFADPAVVGFDSIGDLTLVTEMDPTIVDLRTLAQSEAEALGDRRGRLAIVAVNDLQFGIGRMFEAFWRSEDLPSEVLAFRGIDAAKEWLALPPEWMPER